MKSIQVVWLNLFGVGLLGHEMHKTLNLNAVYVVMSKALMTLSKDTTSLGNP